VRRETRRVILLHLGVRLIFLGGSAVKGHPKFENRGNLFSSFVLTFPSLDHENADLFPCSWVMRRTIAL
jgi:hypothetical protein